MFHVTTPGRTLLFSAVLLSFPCISASAQSDATDYIVLMKETFAEPTKKELVRAKKADGKRDQRKQESDKLKPVREAKLEKFAQGKGVEKKIKHRYSNTLVGFSATLTKAEADALRADPEVESIEPEVQLTLGPVLPIMNPIMLTQKTTCAVTNAGGFADGSKKSNWIWIIDTGIDTDHPDLTINLDPRYARSFVTGDPSVEDCNGHGTHVAGIAAARNNTIGIVGISAGATVVPVRIAGCEGTAASSAILAAIDHIGGCDVYGDVVNLSFGHQAGPDCGTAYSPALKRAIQVLTSGGTSICFAAGNEGALAREASPGCINGTRIYTIGALNAYTTNCLMGWASYSNTGTDVIDWVATGTDVQSTWLNGGYATCSGTSMAAPVVAGIIHARGGAPLEGGGVNDYSGTRYKVARRAP